MTPRVLSPEAVRNWLPVARHLVKVRAKSIPGLGRDDRIAVEDRGGYAALVDSQIELAVAPGCVVDLADVRIYYESEV
jgi:hypothetical protein